MGSLGRMLQHGNHLRNSQVGAKLILSQFTAVTWQMSQGLNCPSKNFLQTIRTLFISTKYLAFSALSKRSNNTEHFLSAPHNAGSHFNKVNFCFSCTSWNKHKPTHSKSERKPPCPPSEMGGNKIVHSKPLVARFTEELDLEELKAEVREEKKAGSDVTLVQKIKERVEQRCAEAIANLTETEQKQLKVIQLEHNFLYSEGYEILATEEMTNENWLEALSLSSKLQRLQFYLFLQRRAYLRAGQKTKQKVRKDRSEVTPMNIYEHGRIFMRIYDSTIRKWDTHRLSATMQFGIPLVLDMDYEQEMKAQDIRNTASQLHDLYGHNRKDPGEPFHLHFLNCREDNSSYKLFQIYYQDNVDIMMTVSEKSYLDLFDKRQLIYLSPNGRQVMHRFDPNAVYIVGAFNDKASNKRVSYARATEEGIRCQRLPLDEHLNWTTGRKDLTLDQVLRILQAVKNKESWKDAFRFVPKRKYKSDSE